MSHWHLLMGNHVFMDFYLGPAVLLLDEEEFGVRAFIDSEREGDTQDWGGFLETGDDGDVIRFRMFDTEEAFIRVPGSSARDIALVCANQEGLVFVGMGCTPLPLRSRRISGPGGTSQT